MDKKCVLNTCGGKSPEKIAGLNEQTLLKRRYSSHTFRYGYLVTT